MPVNRNALIRYKTIDKCLQNRYRKWTLDDLIDACSDALYEYEGITKGVSKRTVQADIQIMRSDKLGYNAPIIVEDKKYYTYEEKDYSITNIPLTDQDLGKLSEAVAFLKEFKGFSHFQELDGMIQKLEDHVYAQKTNQQPVIDFEKNENLRGLNHLDTLYQAIIQKKTILLTYQSFKARQANDFVFHPYLLKEYRNRWFILGTKDQTENIMTLALDRIVNIEKSDIHLHEIKDFEPSAYFKNVVGVTVNPNEKPQEVVLFLEQKNAPYVLTKPIHPSQQLISKDKKGVYISLNVQLNFELERVILGFGDGARVIRPAHLKRRIKGKLYYAYDAYEAELEDDALQHKLKIFTHRGFIRFPQLYTRKEVDSLCRYPHKYLSHRNSQQEERTVIIEDALDTIPELKDLVFNDNLNKVLNTLNKDAKLFNSTFFDLTPSSEDHIHWHQRLPTKDSKKPSLETLQNFFSIHLYLDGIQEKDGALKVVPGSQNKILKPKEIDLISQNCTPTCCEMKRGGVLLMRPLLLQAHSPTPQVRRKRVLVLDFVGA